MSIIDSIFTAATGKTPEEYAKGLREPDLSDTQAPVRVSGTLGAGEITVKSFRSAEKGSRLRNSYPFVSVGVYNATAENITAYINQRKGLSLPVPSGAQNGDDFEEVGITSIEIVNDGANPIDLSKLNIIVSGRVGGVARVSK